MLNMSTQQESSIEAYAVDGRPLYRASFTPETEHTLTANLNDARHRYEAEPDNADAIIWLGRRLGYLTRYQEAIEVFSQGLERYPHNYKLLRHRGHRYLSIRKFDLALADFTAAACLIQDVPDEFEPDGIPNAAGVPTSTNHFNIWYHLGLTHYLMGHYEAALESYTACRAFCPNDDSVAALANWQYNTLLKLDRKSDAQQQLEPITRDMTIIDDPGYYHLLLHHKGVLEERELLNPDDDNNLESVTIAYGIANRALCYGDTAKALRLIQRILKCDFWPAFGYIAAEVDSVHMQTNPLKTDTTTEEGETDANS